MNSPHPPRLPSGNGTAGPPPDDATVLHLPGLWRSVWRRRGWLLGTPLVVMLLVALWTWLQTPEYEARASLLIEGQQSGGGGLLAEQVAAFTGLGGSRGSLETDLRLLESREIIATIVDSLALQVRVREPDLPRSDLFSHVSAGQDAFAGALTLTPAGGGAYAVQVESPASPGLAVPDRVAPGDSFAVGGISLRLTDALPLEAREGIELEVRSFRSAVQDFRDFLAVERSGGSNIVEVSYRHPDADLSAAAANGLVQRFIDYRRETNQSDARGAIEFLREQVALYERQLREAEATLQSFREREQVVSPEADATRQVQRISTLETQRAQLVGEREVLTELLREVSAGGPGQTSRYRRLAAFPEFFRNPAVQNILQSLVQLENQRAELLIRRTEDNADVRGLTERIQELEEQLLLTAQNYVASLDEQIAALDRTLSQTTGEAARVPGIETEFLRLSRDVEMLDEIYTLLQMRLKEQEVTEADRRSDVRLLDAALVPLRPASPRPLLNLILALVIGSMLGLAIALARAALDRGLYSREAVVAVAGGVPILSSIPAGPRSQPRLLPPGGGARLNLPFSRAALPGGSTPGLAEPGTPVAEAYTSLRTRLVRFSSPPPQVILVTSPREGDGKSTVAANLALVYARHGARTLLLEADLRKGDLKNLLHLPDGVGSLGEVLAGGAPVQQSIVPFRTGDDAASLDVLLAGRVKRHAAELLDSDSFAQLIAQLRATYEVIVVDTPPLDAVSDALIVGRVADGALLVTKAGATDRTALESAVDELDRIGAHVHGLVLNGFEPSGSSRYAYEAD